LICDEIDKYILPGFVLDAVAAFYGVVSVNTVGKLQALPGLDADKAFLGNFDTIASTGSIYTLQDQGIVLSIHS
jgi:hypothetical protein